MAVARTDDRTLVEASLAGDAGAFTRIVERYQTAVCSVAYSSVGDFALSEDVAQETFLRAWRRLAELRDQNRLGAWLCGIARNVAYEHLRRRRRDAPAETEAPEDVPSTAARPDEAAMASERAALVWGALEDLPEPYRETLVLFYREGQSARAVAEAFGTTEENTRQRLVRGRQMLKEQVAALVEDALVATRPTQAFTGAVAALLVPAMAKGGLGASAAKGASAAGVAGAAAKGVAGLGIGVLGGLAGMLAGFLGGLIGAKAGIRSSRTLRLRRYVIKTSGLTYAFIWGFFAVQGVLGILLWRSPTLMYTASAGVWIAYVALLFLLIARSNLRYWRIWREDAGMLPAPDVPIEASDLSLGRVRWSLVWTLSTGVVGSLVVVGWAWGYPAIHDSWPYVAAIAALSHLSFGWLLVRAYRTVRSEESLRAACPEGPPPFSEPPAVSPEQRWRSISRGLAGSLAGSILGPMCWMFVASTYAGTHVDTALLFGVSFAVLAVGCVATLRNPRKGYLINAACMAFMAVFSPAAILFLWPRWSEAAGDEMRYEFPVGGALIYLLLYGCFAFAMLCLHRRRKELQP